MERLEGEKVGNCLGQRTVRRYLNANHDIYESDYTPRIEELACEMMGALFKGGGGRKRYSITAQFGNLLLSAQLH